MVILQPAPFSTAAQLFLGGGDARRWGRCRGGGLSGRWAPFLHRADH